MPLELALNILSPKVVTTMLTVEVHAGKAAKLTVKAEAVLPAIEVAESGYEFGEVSIGATSKLPVTISNPSAVPAGKSVCCCLLVASVQGIVSIATLPTWCGRC